LVEHDHEMPAVEHGGPGALPALARELRRELQILALPAEAVPKAFDGQTELLEHAVLAEARGRHLHELEDANALAMHVRASEGAQRQAEGRRALALAVAGVHDDQAAAFTLGLVVWFVGGWGFDLLEVLQRLAIRPATPPTAHRAGGSRCGGGTPLRARGACRPRHIRPGGPRGPHPRSPCDRHAGPRRSRAAR